MRWCGSLAITRGVYRAAVAAAAIRRSVLIVPGATLRQLSREATIAEELELPGADGYEAVDFDIDVTLGRTIPMAQVAPIYYNATAGGRFRRQSVLLPRGGIGCALARGARTHLRAVALTVANPTLTLHVWASLTRGGVTDVRAGGGPLVGIAAFYEAWCSPGGTTRLTLADGRAALVTSGERAALRLRWARGWRMAAIRDDTDVERGYERRRSSVVI
jgi:hypothetical protein